MSNKVREQIAEIEHEQWAHWTRYFLDNLSEENIKRWERQIETPYSELTEQEKDSDRKWAEKILDIEVDCENQYCENGEVLIGDEHKECKICNGTGKITLEEILK